MNKRFSGKTIIITGASAGVGAACARAFATQKANLVLVARGQQGLDIIEKELSAQTKVVTVAMDVSNVEQCLALLVKAEEEFGTVDVLVNNAGMHSRGDLETVDPADVGAMVDINIRAPLVLSCAAIPYLRRTGGGGIVMVGSLAGMAPLQGAATYSGTKAGLRAFAYALADEMRGTRIHVGVVSPGPPNQKQQTNEHQPTNEQHRTHYIKSLTHSAHCTAQKGETIAIFCFGWFPPAPQSKATNQ